MAVRDGPLLPKEPGGSSGCFAAFLLGRHGIVALKTALMLPYEGLGRGTLSRYTHRAGKTLKIKQPPSSSVETPSQASRFPPFCSGPVASKLLTPYGIGLSVGDELEGSRRTIAAIAASAHGTQSRGAQADDGKVMALRIPSQDEARARRGPMQGP